MLEKFPRRRCRPFTGVVHAEGAVLGQCDMVLAEQLNPERSVRPPGLQIPADFEQGGLFFRNIVYAGDNRNPEDEIRLVLRREPEVVEHLFQPDRVITRAEFTSMAMKFTRGTPQGTNIFSDVKSTDWFYRAVVNSTQYGWIHGYGDGTFRPNNPITRVEVTAIVNNMLGREADVDFVTEHYDELNHFSDLEVSHWGYYHIVEATNDHDYTKPSSGENWTELN